MNTGIRVSYQRLYQPAVVFSIKITPTPGRDSPKGYKHGGDYILKQSIMLFLFVATTAVRYTRVVFVELP